MSNDPFTPAKSVLIQGMTNEDNVDCLSESSEESNISDEGSNEFSEVLKHLTRNSKAQEFSAYCHSELLKRRERIFRNTFGTRNFSKPRMM